VTSGLGERGGELRPALDRVRTLAGLCLDEFRDDFEALGVGEAGDGRALRLDPETGACSRVDTRK